MLIFQGSRYAVRKVEVAGTGPVVVTFPHAGGPTMGNGVAFAEVFLKAKGVDAYHLLNAEVDWCQHEEFWQAVAAIRADIHPDREIVTYGSSMGGYGALLASGRLQAARVLAVVPQFSIDRNVVPWERRWKEHAERIGPFVQDLEAEIAPQARIITLHDPRNSDAAQMALFRQRDGWLRLTLPYTGHTPLVVLQQAGLLSRFVTDVIRGDADLATWMPKMLQARRKTRSYWRIIAMHAVRRRRFGLADIALARLRELGAPQLEVSMTEAAMVRTRTTLDRQATRMAEAGEARAARLARVKG